MADLNLKAGQTAQSQDGRQGVIRYIGPLHIAAGEWIGLELPDNTGKNDGSVKGERYFQCPPGYGIFVRKESVVKVVKQPAPAQRSNGASTPQNGSAIRPRPSGIAPADAKKRQSLMSAASRQSTTGSRLSMISPSKSPTKAMSSASSAASTPRTGTPATTARTSDSSTKSRLSTTGRASMAPPAAPVKPPAKSATRASIGGTARPTTTARPGTINSRQSLSGSRLSIGPRGAPTPAQPFPKPISRQQMRSPTIDEEEQQEDYEPESMATLIHPLPTPIPLPEEVTSPTAESTNTTTTTSPSHTRTTSLASRAPITTVESRTQDKREVEQLKAKIRTLEKKALESRDKIKSIDTLQSDKDRFEHIIQTLQRKLKANSEEMASLRSKYDEIAQSAAHNTAAASSSALDDQSAEFESQLELAQIDKEMAEERAEIFKQELESLKGRFEELELEADILKEENRELVESMSPEEMATKGWLQMERETERLRQALILLRDHSQQLEADLRGEVRELRGSLDESEKVAGLYEQAREELGRVEARNGFLMEQLEEAQKDDGDDVLMALEQQREEREAVIEQLKKQVQEFEEHIQVTDELELFHVEEEKRLHGQLDESEALLSERLRQAGERDKVVEDLEYTLTKFRDVVQGLQSDINELRRSRDISELEAHEMSSKSKAMMDLNMQLQNSAAKSQLKTIDYEMGRMQAEQAKSQLDIVQLFVPESYNDKERNPVLAMLCFKRIKSKAVLAKNILVDRMRDRPHLAMDDPFIVYEVIEELSWISICCDRFLWFMSTCSPDEFAQYSNALYELEPVERSMTGWVEALKRDELGPDPPEYLHRMMGIMQDMAEKLIAEGDEAKAVELISQSQLLETYADSTASQLVSVVKAVQSRLGPARDEDEESMVFDKRMDQFGTRARTIKYLGTKVTQLLTDLRAGSMCLGEAFWMSFEDAEKAAEQIASFVRQMGKAVVGELSNIHSQEAPSYNSLTGLMAATAQQYLEERDPRAQGPDDVFSFLASQLQSLQSKIDDLQVKAGDFTSATEFEVKPAPWTVRAKEIKAKKIVDQDTQQDLARLKTQAQEQMLQIAEKDRSIDEQKIKIEVLESRQKESKKGETDVKALREQVAALQAEKSDLHSQLQETRTQHTQLSQERELENAELENLKKTIVEEGGVATATKLGENSEMASHLKVQVDMLNIEMLSLQAAVRYLKAENYGLRVPLGEIALQSAQNAWLDPTNLRKSRRIDDSREKLRKEGEDALDGLIDLAQAAKPVRLGRRGLGEYPQKARDNLRWQVAKQREEAERWAQWRDDLVKRGKVELRERPVIERRAGAMATKLTSLPRVSMKKRFDGALEEVRIVATSP